MLTVLAIVAAPHPIAVLVGGVFVGLAAVLPLLARAQSAGVTSRK